MNQQPILTTERLELIPLNAPQLRKWIDDLPGLEVELDCRCCAEPMVGWFLEIVKKQAEITERDPENYLFHSFWFLVRREDRVVVGSADFKDLPDKNGAVEIGYGLGKEFEHHGYMTEAVRAMVEWAFQQPGVASVIAETENDNSASQHILTRCGFRKTSEGESTWWRLPKPIEKMSLAELWQLFPIILQEHCPQWQDWYTEEAARIRLAIGEENIVRIRHIGSTSVPGLIAKPTIDILLEIADSCDLSKLTAKLKSIDYLCETKLENPPPHLMFMKGYTDEGFAERVFHLHVRYQGDWNEPSFCAYLRAHPDVARAYAQLKRDLKERYEHDRDGYTNAKSDFINAYTKWAREEWTS